jgi:hypothetical protein
MGRMADGTPIPVWCEGTVLLHEDDTGTCAERDCPGTGERHRGLIDVCRLDDCSHCPSGPAWSDNV